MASKAFLLACILVSAASFLGDGVCEAARVLLHAPAPASPLTWGSTWPTFPTLQPLPGARIPMVSAKAGSPPEPSIPSFPNPAAIRSAPQPSVPSPPQPSTHRIPSYPNARGTAGSPPQPSIPASRSSSFPNYPTTTLNVPGSPANPSLQSSQPFIPTFPTMSTIPSLLNIPTRIPNIP